MTYVLRVSRPGKRPHFSEGFTDLDEAERVKAKFEAAGKEVALTKSVSDPPPQNQGENLNDCEKAFEILANHHAARFAARRLTIRRKAAAAGTLSDGTRDFIVSPCPRSRWLVVCLGWDTIAEIDQRDHFAAPNRMALAVLEAIENYAEAAQNPTFGAEPTPEGEKVVILGRDLNSSPKETQLDLFG